MGFYFLVHTFMDITCQMAYWETKRIEHFTSTLSLLSHILHPIEDAELLIIALVHHLSIVHQRRANKIGVRGNRLIYSLRDHISFSFQYTEKIRFHHFMGTGHCYFVLCFRFTELSYLHRLKGEFKYLISIIKSLLSFFVLQQSGW
jgi:hypothetical protein